jgi:ABC-2 type transport system permease protein
VSLRGASRRLLPPSPREWRAFWALTQVEALLAARRLENLVVTLGLPLLLLIVFTAVPVLRSGPGDPLAALVPGVLAAGLMATGLVSLAIATAFERGYGVLKRLAASPAPTWAILASRVVVVTLTVLMQLLLISFLALALGWRPPAGLLLAIAAALPWVLLGTLCFCAAGLLLAGRLRPEVVLAAANGLYLLFLLLGGVLIPLDRLPAPLAFAAGLLPPALLTGLLGEALGGGIIDPFSAAALAAWTLGLVAVAINTFRAAG